MEDPSPPDGLTGCKSGGFVNGLPFGMYRRRYAGSVLAVAAYLENACRKGSLCRRDGPVTIGRKLSLAITVDRKTGRETCRSVEKALDILHQDGWIFTELRKLTHLDKPIEVHWLRWRLPDTMDDQVFQPIDGLPEPRPRYPRPCEESFASPREGICAITPNGAGSFAGNAKNPSHPSSMEAYSNSENKNKTLTACAGSADPERPSSPVVPPSETEAERESALRAHWAEMSTTEQEAIAAGIKAANPEIVRFKNMAEPLYLKALERARSDLFPPLPEPPPDRGAPIGAPPPQFRTDVARAIAELQPGEVNAVVADAIFGLGDMHSGDFYRILHDLIAGDPAACRRAAVLYDYAESMISRPGRIAVPLPKGYHNPGHYYTNVLRKEVVGIDVHPPPERGAQKNRPPGRALTGNPDGRPEQQSRPQLNGT